MIFLRGESISELYPQLLARVLDEGEEISPRGMPTVEVTPLGFEITDPTQCLVRQRARRLNYAYAIVERMSLLSGKADPEMLCFYVDKLWDYVNPETRCFDGAYGPRVRPQLDYVCDELRRDPASRRAVISIYSEADQYESLDVPCTLALHFLIRHGKLDLIVNMRSSDLFLGLPYDVNQFAFLQQVIAAWLNIEPGRYIHWAHSAHIYKMRVPRAWEVISEDAALLDITFKVPRLAKQESLDQVSLLLEIEHGLRLGKISDPKTSLSPAYQQYAAYLQEYVSRRKQRTAKSQLVTT